MGPELSVTGSSAFSKPKGMNASTAPKVAGARSTMRAKGLGGRVLRSLGSMTSGSS